MKVFLISHPVDFRQGHPALETGDRRTLRGVTVFERRCTGVGAIGSPNKTIFFWLLQSR